MIQSPTLRRLDEAKSLFELHADNVKKLTQKIETLTSEQRQLTLELERTETNLSKLKTELESKNRDKRQEEIKMGLAANSVEEYKRKLNEEIEDQRREARLGASSNDSNKSSGSRW